MKALQEQNPTLENASVHINVSSKQFYDPHLLDRATAAAQSSGLKPERLKLEITEKTLIANPRSADATISKLHTASIQVQIDDYGTGHSAFAALQRLPIEAIKIDRFFVRNMSRDQKVYGLVRAIITMAREMGMATVAEGIETPEQLKDLRDLLCGAGQGFLLSEPLDAESVCEALDGFKAAKDRSETRADEKIQAD